MSGVLGIDPGKDGGLAIRTKRWVLAEAMPVTEDGIDAAELATWLKFNREHFDFVLLERVSAMPKQGVAGMFKFGRSFGVIEGLLAGLRIPYELITPAKWSAAFPHGVQETEDRNRRQRQIKAARKEIASRLFPTVDLRRTEKCSTAHEGMVDALLIAEYGYRLRKGNA